MARYVYSKILICLCNSDAPRALTHQLGTSIIALDAHDIVLAEVAAGLHLDQLKIDLARIFQAVSGTARNIGRFIFMQDLGVVADGDARGATHHDPVLGAAASRVV